ncbi:MAG: RHS repeat-associated core domain-containing protein, partial [Blastocatellia bacterium]
LYLYSGEQFDPDLGLYYQRARYLNTSTGRFWTMDRFQGRIEDPPSLHKYSYGKDDPVDRRDPSGKDSIAELMIAIAIVVVVATMSSCLAVHIPDDPYIKVVENFGLADADLITQHVVYGWKFTAYVIGRAAPQRFVVVQWMTGSFKANGKPVAIGVPFHDNSGVLWDFDNWVIDTGKMADASYPYATELNDHVIIVDDIPGAKGFPEPGTIYEANLHFIVNVYDKSKLDGMSVFHFQDPWNPPPVVSTSWDFVGTHMATP